ncbi:MAG: squalene synthase HpnC [Burkholderiaceae bacterium]|nr:squalene synthase HpnC [Burkholderiaceae bacterium]
MSKRFGAAAIRAVEHYENFPVASLLVPARLRAPISSIYRFARYADDVADEGDAGANERLEELSRLADSIRGRGRHPVVASLAPWRERFDLPDAPFLALLSAFAQDVEKKRYRDDGELLDYCRRSANPVGELVLRLFGRWTESNRIPSDAICTALQLINFLQDIAQDWERGRLYLPTESLREFGIDEQQVDAATRGETPDRRLRGVIAARARQAAGFLDTGIPLLRDVPWRLSLELRAVMAGGRRVIERLIACGHDPFAAHIRLGLGDIPACTRLFVRATRAQIRTLAP